MTRDFNIKDNDWNLVYSYYSTHTDILIEIADSLDLRLSISVNQVLT